MKKGAKRLPPETSVDRYDWSRARQGHFVGKLQHGHVVPIDDDVWDSFPDAKLINDALRALAAVAVATKAKKKARPRRTSVT